VEYAAAVWDPHHQNQITQIEKVQRRAARFVTHNYDPRASVTAMLSQLGWQSLAHRRITVRLVMAYRITHNLVAIPAATFFLPVSRISRHTNPYTFRQIQCNRDFYKYSYFPRTIVQWNRLPLPVLSAPSLDSFKAQLQGVDLSSMTY
jgi:hypothetical protein